MQNKVKYQSLILISNGLTRLLGNIVKILSYPFHFVFPKNGSLFLNLALQNVNQR